MTAQQKNQVNSAEIVESGATLVKEIMMPEYVRGLDRHDLPRFCDEVRAALIEIVSKTGGHIGVNLGVVELTVALYHVFDFDHDALVWDIGHQIYIQKMLTGRLPNLREIRVNGGSPGYAFRDESHYDRVTSSHAGAALSLAVGTMIANRLDGNDDISIGVVGDGAIIEGSSQEALNHMGVEKGRMLAILNDNEMALDNNFGGLHEYFKTRQMGADTPETFFASLGISYSGPIDGHDVLGLVDVFTDYKNNLDRPTVLHIKTVKGKGLEDMADRSPVRIHWNFPFDTSTLENTEEPKSPSYAGAFSAALGEILENDPKAYVVTPATLQNTGIFGLKQRFPDRVLDVGMAEQHAVTVACGLALEGWKPIVCFESTFLMRAFDQLVHDVCISNLPVLIVGARSGHTGLDHLTHHSMFDLSYLPKVANLGVDYPESQAALQQRLKELVTNLDAPQMLLFPYGGTIDDPTEDINTDRDKGACLDADILVLSAAMQNKLAQPIAADLGAAHMAVTRFAPLTDNLKAAVCSAKYIVTIEENFRTGGLGSMVLEVLNDAGLSTRVKRFGFPCGLIEHGTRDYINEKYGLDRASVVAGVKADRAGL